MAQTSGDQTKDGSQPGGGSKDASNQANPATAATTTSTATVHDPEQDKDFDPSAQALIDEIDDERTLEEEEALAAADSAAVQNEIDDLKRESEMPIEELLAFYERMRNDEAAAAGANDNEEEEFEEDEEEEMDDEDDDEDGDDEGDEIDEVRKRRADKSVTDNNTYDSRTDHRLAHQPTSEHQSIRSTQQLQTTQLQQANSHLSNSHILLSPRQQNPRPSDVSLSNNPQIVPQSDVDISGRQTHSQCQDSATIGSENSTSTSIPPTSENNSYGVAGQQQKQYDHAEHHHHHHHHHNLNYPQQQQQQSMEAGNTVSFTNPRTHRHSMTEFLVDSESAASGIFKTLLDYDLEDSDDLDEDYSYTDDENTEDEREWRRVIHVGPEYQADVPEGLSEYENDLPPYENVDTLVWRCNPEQEQIIDYLKQASTIAKRNDISLSPASVPKISEQNVRLYRERMQDSTSVTTSLHPIERNHENINTSENPPENLQDVYMSQSRKRLRIDSELEQENTMDGLIQPSGDMPIVNQIDASTKDDNSNSVSQDARPELSTEDYFQGEEQLLYLLLQCNHNFDEALRRRRLDPYKYYISEPMSLWSQEECLNFEHGLRTYGKNFRSIRDAKVPTRTRAEVVAFYYLWKKSERHDVYTNQYKLDRKRCLSHPGTTDYMDKFIEDNESALNASSSTPTPTPTDSTVDVHQISHIANVASNQSISICSTSDHEIVQVDDPRPPQEVPTVQGTCNELDHQAKSDDNRAETNSFYLDSHTSI